MPRLQQPCLHVLIDAPSSVQINCVVMRGVNDDELPALAALAAHAPVQVRFIELMPFAGNEWEVPGEEPSDASLLETVGMGTSATANASCGSSNGVVGTARAPQAGSAVIGYREMVAAIAAAHPGFAPVPHASRSGVPGVEHDTAKLWAVPGWRGTVGFITTITSAFCGTCNRVRLTADGALKPCLHGNTEGSLRDALRRGASDAEVEAVARAVVARKAAALGGSASLAALAAATRQAGARPMVKIGG